MYEGWFPQALGAVLPCYWIYAEIGRHLVTSGSPNPFFQRWIETYGGDEFAAIVKALLELTDRVGHDLSPPDEAHLRERFVTTSRYEWMFWDAAWRGETWPV